ncbi:hypothetical protein BP5796_10227 [Coleophoma crateriformis]|uniref:Uncharacterized protein n=1 Tax=Coleophoma crateriformis TaxID=565419 RepID=A0A3D8QUT7_9HELO|nr:hypothetical protein BP5796_10227 [Coleophoma crateriformis]
MILQRRVYGLCRNTTKNRTTSPTHEFRRPWSAQSPPSASRYTDYVLSPLVIELDAADNPHVRNFDDLEEHERENLFGTDLYKAIPKPKKSQLKATTEEVPKGHERNKTQGLKTSVVTPPDILSFVLYGESTDRVNLPRFYWEYAANTEHLLWIYRFRGVQRKKSIMQNSRNLLYTFTTDKDEMRKRALLGPEQIENIVEEIQTCTDFAHLRRMTSIITQTPEGCDLIALHGEALITGIDSCRTYANDPPDSIAILSYLNGLSSNLIPKGFKIGPDLCSYAIDMAAKACVLPAVYKYLKLAHIEGYLPTYRAYHAMKILCRLGEQTRGVMKTWNISSGDTWKKHRLLRLLSGWESVEAAKSGAPREFCFMTFLENNETSQAGTFYDYILSLGKLGEKEMIWHEWNIRSSSQEKDCLDARADAEVFAVSFLLTGDTAHAIDVLQGTGSSTLTRAPVKKKYSVERPNEQSAGLLPVLAIQRSLGGTIEDVLTELDISRDLWRPNYRLIWERNSGKVRNTVAA